MEIVLDETGAGPRVVLSGDLDVRCSRELRAALQDQLDVHRLVVLDLAAITSIDLTALRVVANAGRQAARGGRTLAVQGCSPAVRRMLHLGHLGHDDELSTSVSD